MRTYHHLNYRVALLKIDRQPFPPHHVSYLAPDETAQSHLFRIMEFWNIEIWDDISTNAISKEVILTLLQCAARLYEDKLHAKAAVNLIESTHTRVILSLAIQNVLFRFVNQQYIKNIRSDKSEKRTTKNHKERADEKPRPGN